MAFLKFGKKKTESIEPAPMPPGDMAMAPQIQSSPVDQVIMMKQQGYAHNQIVQALQSQGYNTQQVYDAINQASMNASTMPQAEMPQPEVMEYHPPMDTSQYAPPNYQQQDYGASDERIQEIAEAIIDEKWEELAKEIKKVVEWKEKSEDRIAKLEQQMIDLRLSIDSLTKSIIQKISAYDQSIVDVGVEIKAMEKVFQKVLPSLTENVNKLDRMTKDYKDPLVPKGK